MRLASTALPPHPAWLPQILDLEIFPFIKSLKRALRLTREGAQSLVSRRNEGVHDEEFAKQHPQAQIPLIHLPIHIISRRHSNKSRVAVRMNFH
jgi:hypothetical protein